MLEVVIGLAGGGDGSSGGGGRLAGCRGDGGVNVVIIDVNKYDNKYIFLFPQLTLIF